MRACSVKKAGMEYCLSRYYGRTQGLLLHTDLEVHVLVLNCIICRALTYEYISFTIHAEVTLHSERARIVTLLAIAA